MVCVKFEETSWYCTTAVAAMLRVPERAVKKMIRAGELKSTVRAGKVFHLGAWCNECMAVEADGLPSTAETGQHATINH